jgi:hypothetical protein
MILGDYNQADPNLPGQNIPLQQRRPIQGFNDIQISFGGGHSSYHSLQWKVEKRYAQGLYLLNSFTWSKAIDNAAGHLESANGDNSRVNYRNLPGEKGLGSYNQPWNNTTSLVWEVPYGKGRRWSGNGIANAVIGGWRVTGIHTATAGLPINVTYGPPAAFSVSGYPTYRPNYLGGDIYSPDRAPTNYFNKAAFIAPSTATPNDPSNPFGNLGRNVASSESVFNFDFGLHKDFPLPYEEMRIEFRSEFFNLFNTTNLGTPATNVLAGDFGVITTLSSPARQIQFALKFVF